MGIQILHLSVATDTHSFATDHDVRGSLQTENQEKINNKVKSSFFLSPVDNRLSTTVQIVKPSLRKIHKILHMHTKKY